MTDSDKPRDRRGRWSRYLRPEQQVDLGSPFTLSEQDALVQQKHFGVARDQIEHDFTISHVLAALAPHADLFVFYGGTALSRTILDGLRLSEDIDLLSLGSHSQTAKALDQAIQVGLEREFGKVTANPWMSDAPSDTTACIYRIGNVQLKMQLMDGQHCTDWPRQTSEVSQRYAGIPNVSLTTYSPEGFACAKTIAWCDTTRNAPRDLYDLWAMADRGYITAEAALVYKRFGPTNGFPRTWVFPRRAPSGTEWHDALGNQCIPEVEPDEAYETVISAWEVAVVDAESRGLR
jgi:hypothetical protein